jgi:hypothetical protein
MPPPLYVPFPHLRLALLLLSSLRLFALPLLHLRALLHPLALLLLLVPLLLLLVLLLLLLVLLLHLRALLLPLALLLPMALLHLLAPLLPMAPLLRPMSPLFPLTLHLQFTLLPSLLPKHTRLCAFPASRSNMPTFKSKKDGRCTEVDVVTAVDGL